MLYNSFLIHPLKDDYFNVNSATLNRSESAQQNPATSCWPKGCIRNKKKLGFLCSVLIQSWLFCSVFFFFLSLLINMARLTLQMKLNLFAQPFYCKLWGREVLGRFMEILIFKVINKSQRNQKGTIGPMPHTLCGLKKLHLMMANFPFKNTLKQSLSSRNVFWARLAVNFPWRA